MSSTFVPVRGRVQRRCWKLLAWLQLATNVLMMGCIAWLAVDLRRTRWSLNDLDAIVKSRREEVARQQIAEAAAIKNQFVETVERIKQQTLEMKEFADREEARLRKR